MAEICFNHRGSTAGGGPVTFIYKTARELQRRGHSVTYSNPHIADAAICIIETGKFRKMCAGAKTKILLRIDGIYNAEYNEKFNRAIRPDMTALHAKLTEDIPAVDHVVYQSSWSKERIDDEIVKRQDDNWSVIHNGVDTDVFVPNGRKNDGFLNLLHVGLMRDDYLMEMLIGTYLECKRRGANVRLILAGGMDKACQEVFAKYKQDPNIQYLGKFKNTQLSDVYAQGDIFLGVRQGSSSDNVIAEAQACGVPVVVPIWGGNIDMVVHEQTGCIVPSGHWDYNEEYINNLAHAVGLISNDLEQYKKNAREHAMAELGIDKMVDKYLKALNM